MTKRLECPPAIVAITPQLLQVSVLVSEGLIRGLPLRMTVVVDDGVVSVISPALIDDDTFETLIKRVGRIDHVVAPNLNHHLFFQDFVGRCFIAGMRPTLWGPPGLVEKVRALSALSMRTLSDDVKVSPGLSQRLLQGVPLNNEVVFFHHDTRTLIVTDAMMAVREHPYVVTRTMFRMIGAYGGAKQPLLWRVRAKTRSALRASVDDVLRWPFERVVGAHGDVVDRGAAAAFARVFRWV